MEEPFGALSTRTPEDTEQYFQRNVKKTEDARERVTLTDF